VISIDNFGIKKWLGLVWKQALNDLSPAEKTAYFCGCCFMVE